LESLHYGVDYFGSGGKNDAAFKDGGKFVGLFETGTDLDLLPDTGVFCPAGMVWVGVNRLNSGFCIDAYEASWSEGNKPVSAANRNPWSFLPVDIFPYFSQSEAAGYCQSAGKRLPEDYEWFFGGARHSRRTDCAGHRRGGLPSLEQPFGFTRQDPQAERSGLAGYGIRMVNLQRRFHKDRHRETLPLGLRRF